MSPRITGTPLHLKKLNPGQNTFCLGTCVVEGTVRRTILLFFLKADKKPFLSLLLNKNWQLRKKDVMVVGKHQVVIKIINILHKAGHRF